MNRKLDTIVGLEVSGGRILPLRVQLTPHGLQISLLPSADRLKESTDASKKQREILVRLVDDHLESECVFGSFRAAKLPLFPSDYLFQTDQFQLLEAIPDTVLPCLFNLCRTEAAGVPSDAILQISRASILSKAVDLTNLPELLKPGPLHDRAIHAIESCLLSILEERVGEAQAAAYSTQAQHAPASQPGASPGASARSHPG